MSLLWKGLMCHAPGGDFLLYRKPPPTVFHVNRPHGQLGSGGAGRRLQLGGPVHLRAAATPAGAAALEVLGRSIHTLQQQPATSQLYNTAGEALQGLTSARGQSRLGPPTSPGQEISNHHWKKGK